MDAATAAAAASLVWAVREAVLRDQGSTDASTRNVPPAVASAAGHTDVGDSGAGEAGASAKKKPGRKPGSGPKAKAKGEDEEGAEEKGSGGGGEAGGEVVVKKKRGRPPGSGKKKAEGEDGGGGGGGEKKKRKVPRPVGSGGDGSDGSDSDDGSDEDLGSKWKKRKQQGRASEAAAASGKGGGDSAAAAAAASSKSAAGGSVGSPVKAAAAEPERVTEAQVMADLEALRARGDAAALNLAMFGGPVGQRLPGGTAQVLRGVRALAAVAAVGDAEAAASRAALEDGALDAVAAVYLRYRELRYHWSRLYCAP